MGKTEVLVLWEPCGHGRSRRHQSFWSLSCRRRFRRGVCNPRRRCGLSTVSVLSRGRVWAFLRGCSFQVLLRNELKQSSGHGRADVLAELGLRLRLLGAPRRSGRGRWWSGWRRGTLVNHLVDQNLFPFRHTTIYQTQGKTKKLVRTEKNNVHVHFCFVV